MKTINSKSIILSFCIKSILSSAISILLLSYLFSLVIYKFDISLDYLNTVSIIICALSSIITSVISNIGFKNSGAIMGILSCVPIVLYSLLSIIIFHNPILYFTVKILLIVILSALFGNLVVKRNRRIKV